nr:S8 family serine peptidase [Actinomyces sp.]
MAMPHARSVRALAASVAVALAGVLTPVGAFAADPSPDPSPDAPTAAAPEEPVPAESASGAETSAEPAPADPTPVPSAPAQSGDEGGAGESGGSDAAQKPAYTTASGAVAVERNTIKVGTSAADMRTVVPTRARSASTVPYLLSVTLDPPTINNYDYFAVGVTLTATGLGAGERAIITDTSPSGDVHTFDPVTADASGTVTTTVMRRDRVDPEVGAHLIEITADSGSMGGASLDVTLSERLNAKAQATPSTTDVVSYHDTPVTIDGSGFTPGEWVSVHVTTPDGSTGLVSDDVAADAQGKVRYVVQAGSAAVDPGQWTITILGMESTRNGIATYFVKENPDAHQVGTIDVPTQPVSPDQFDQDGVPFTAHGLPAFGLFDLSIRNAHGNDYSVGRYRANGDGEWSDAIYSGGADAGTYTLRLDNVDTADWTTASFTVTEEDGSVPEAPTLVVDPPTVSDTDLMDGGIDVTGTGYQPGELVELTLRDKYQKKMDLDHRVIDAKQADDRGAVSFHVQADARPEAGQWTVIVAGVLYDALTQRAALTVTSADAGDGSGDAGQSGGAPQPGGGTGEAEPDPDTGSAPADGDLPAQEPQTPALAATDAPHAYFVRTSGEGALAYDVREQGARAQLKGVSRTASQRVQILQGTLNRIEETATDLDDESSVLYRSVWTVPGVAVQTTAQVAAELADRPDVVSVRPIVTKTLVEPVDGGDAEGDSTSPTGSDTPANGPSDLLTGAWKTWTGSGGYTGEGQVIAVIDTGLDYTHADFGGPDTSGRLWSQVGAQHAGDAMQPEWYDPSVVIPGWDFAGAAYDADASSSSYHPIAKPDANPIDGPGGGHGTHVAGTAIGRGVNADGTTFAGDYTTLTQAQVSAMKVAPGAAPGAKVIPLKVFGDGGGSTDLTGAALDYVGKLLASGQQVDAINLSLGSAFGAADDPDNDLIQVLSDQGVVPVISAGNSGDITDVGGSPGTAQAALTVAASASGAAVLDTVQVVEPAGSAGDQASQYSQDYPLWFDITAPVVALSDPANLEGCRAFSAADKAAVEGKIVWLEWTDDDATRPCGSATRWDNASDAGAVGVIVTSGSDQFEAGIAGNTAIPGAQLTAEGTQALRPALEAGTLAVRLATSLAQTIRIEDPSLADVIGSFSSRGLHGSVDDTIKPDVSAPGVNVYSAAVGTGTGGTSMSGTSMASPHTAGVVLLTRQAHPDWPAQRIKEVVMNTATHDVVDKAGVSMSTLRQGTGRVDAVQATTSQVTVASIENGAATSASFGVVEVGEGGYTATRTLELTNSGATDQTYTVGYDARTETPGASFSLSADSVTVPAGGSAQVTVTLSAPDPTALRRTIDPGQEATQDTDNHVADLTGVVTFTPGDADAGATPLWLPVFAAPKPVADTSAEAAEFIGGADSATLPVTGTPLDQGDAASGYHSRVTPLVFGGDSPLMDFDGEAAQASLQGVDILRFGAASTSPAESSPSQGTLAVGIETAGPITGLGATSYPTADLDLNGDGRDDFMLMPQLDSENGYRPVVYTIDVGRNAVVDVQPLNNLSSHPGQWDNDTVVYTTSLQRLGYTDTTTSTTLRYRASSQSVYAPVREDGTSIVDQTARVSLDVFAPPIWFATAADQDANPTAVTVTSGSSVEVHAGSADSGKILLVEHDDATHHRTSVVEWSTRDAVKLAILTQPQSQTVAEGGTAEFTVDATGEEPSYQWQERSPGGEWTPSTAEGAATATLTVPGDTALSGHQFRVVVSDAAGSLTSDAATLTVVAEGMRVPAVTLSPDVARAGDEVTLSGADFTPDSAVTLDIGPDGVELQAATTDAAGAFTVTFIVPEGLDVGDHTVTATDAQGLVARASLRIAAGEGGTLPSEPGQSGGAQDTGAVRGLAVTGGTAALAGSLALALLVAGAVLVRRRERGTAPRH